ncbi:reverse transcriptase domain-containing protein [Tanacetum coccineum]
MVKKSRCSCGCAVTSLTLTSMSHKTAIHYRDRRKVESLCEYRSSASWTHTRGITKSKWTRMTRKRQPFIQVKKHFLGYLIKPDGIKPIQNKQKAFLQLPVTAHEARSPVFKWKVRRLTGSYPVSRQVTSPCSEHSRSASKKGDFRGSTAARRRFSQQLKQHIAALPTLVAPRPGEELIMYLSATHSAISAVLLTNRDSVQTPVYFVSKALKETEINYSVMEKLILALVFAAKRLRRYFQAHPIVVITDQPIKQVISKPNASGRLQNYACSDSLLLTPLCCDNIHEVTPRVSALARCDAWDRMGTPTQCVNVCVVHSGKQYVWDNIVCRFGLPGEIVSDNGKQFCDNPFKDWCARLSITQRFASVKHPQTNGLVERANRSLGEGIKARLDRHKGRWVEELSHVLWAHRTTIKVSTGDTPFSLVYGTEAVIPAEIGMPTIRTAEVNIATNDDERRIDLDILEERREQAAIREEKAKLKMKGYYDAKVRGVSFRPGDFVYRANDASHAEDTGKLGPKWEGPYEVTEALGKGAYKLRDMDGRELPRTWNICNLKKCYL